MIITQIESDADKRSIARTILESLPDWFGIPEATEEYIADSKGRPFFCAYEDDAPIGFLYLKETGRHTVELAVMGVLKEYHRQGIGRKLFAEAKNEAKRIGYSFIQVKPRGVEPGQPLGGSFGRFWVCPPCLAPARLRRPHPKSTQNLSPRGASQFSRSVRGSSQEKRRREYPSIFSRRFPQNWTPAARENLAGFDSPRLKTVQMGRYDIYDDTNRFYLSLGFKELEVFPTLWDECNPCQIYIMAI